MAEETIIKAFKGFNPDMRCRDFQYEVGKSYEMTGPVNVCTRGFHACESPLEVLDFYPMFGSNGKENRFCEVEQSGDIDKAESPSSKVCSSKIAIKAEIGFAGLIKAGIEWVKAATTFDKIGPSGENDNGRRFAQIGSSGDGAQIGSSGYGAQIGSSGDGAQIASEGEDAIICCAGDGSIAKAKKGSWVTLSEWEYSEQKHHFVPKMVKTFRIDGRRYKPDTWYRLRDGKVVEVPEEE